MPEFVDSDVKSGKRKRSSAEKHPSKRARSESSEKDPQAHILLLENEIFESKKNYNSIATLIKLLQDHSDDGTNSVLAAVSLCRVFTRLMVAGSITKKSDATEKDAVVIRWLRERYSDYKSALLVLLTDEEVCSTALNLCMRLLKLEGRHLRSSKEYNFPTSFLASILHVLLQPGGHGLARKEFSEKFVEEYDDVRFYTLESLENALGEPRPQGSGGSIFANTLEIMKSIESVPESKGELEDFYIPAPMKETHALYSLTQHKKRAQGAWLALMRLEMRKDQRKSILGLVADSIAPWFTKPELLMDFLTDSYDAGGSTSLLALSGVFYLIQERNLDYPSFYRKLYSLLNSEMFHSKHRSRLFRLLDTFLASTHLPAVLVASFLKRLSRLGLSAPPAGIVAVVPWIYNLLKRHPACTFMIHRETRGADAKELLENEGMDDPFIIDEEDPMDTNAIESSLWEIVSLQSHYHPNVATLANIISEQFTKNTYNLEDFLDHSYASMLEAEHSKNVKKTPVVEFEIPKKVFLKYDTSAGVDDGLVVKLWGFS